MKDPMQQTQTDLWPERSLIELLNETFVIYGAHLKHFILLVALVQIPLGILLLVAVHVPARNAVEFVANILIDSLGGALVYGAAITAVSQHYLFGEINIRRCYSRVTWRILTLCLLALFYATAMFLPSYLSQPNPLLSASDSAMGLFLTIPTALSIIILIWIYPSIPAVMVEGKRAFGALRRTYQLTIGSRWRIVGITFVVALVALGLGIGLFVPFGLLLFGFDLTPEIERVVFAIAGICINATVLPVLFIAGTLLYYDLRVRKEQYNVSTLSREMGIAAA